MDTDPEEAAPGHPDRRRLPPLDLTRRITQASTDKPVAFIVELAELLWPEAEPDADWSPDTLMEIDLLFERYEWHPLPRS